LTSLRYLFDRCLTSLRYLLTALHATSFIPGVCHPNAAMA
jgi:hypothetical protein